MQYYRVSGVWERPDAQRGWFPWREDGADVVTSWFRQRGRTLAMHSATASGDPGASFARGRIERRLLFSTTNDGSWGTDPGLAPVVDVWGDGIVKLATLAITNIAVADSLFG
ncbi:MAG: hypothetical protein ACKO5M_08560 [Vulcanococcus sp.]